VFIKQNKNRWFYSNKSGFRKFKTATAVTVY
jgi:hypothetical protein